jgi:hypothetical protein
MAAMRTPAAAQNHRMAAMVAVRNQPTVAVRNRAAEQSHRMAVRWGAARSHPAAAQHPEEAVSAPEPAAVSPAAAVHR